MGYTKAEVLEWLKHGNVAPRTAEYVPDHEKLNARPKDHLCPKADKCVMDCYHKKPHIYEEKFCNDLEGQCKTKCVHVLWSDVTFFEEDFEID